MSGDLADTLRSVSLVESSWQKDFMSLWQIESYNLISFHQEHYEVLFP